MLHRGQGVPLALAILGRAVPQDKVLCALLVDGCFSLPFLVSFLQRFINATEVADWIDRICHVACCMGFHKRLRG